MREILFAQMSSEDVYEFLTEIVSETKMGLL